MKGTLETEVLSAAITVVQLFEMFFLFLFSSVVEKGIQYISPYYNTWGYGFARLPVNGRREHYSLHDEKPSKEKIEMGKWTVEQVEKHVCSLGCPDQAKLFEEQVSVV